MDDEGHLTDGCGAYRNFGSSTKGGCNCNVLKTTREVAIILIGKQAEIIGDLQGGGALFARWD